MHKHVVFRSSLYCTTPCTLFIVLRECENVYLCEFMKKSRYFKFFLKIMISEEIKQHLPENSLSDFVFLLMPVRTKRSISSGCIKSCISSLGFLGITQVLKDTGLDINYTKKHQDLSESDT